MDTRRPTLPALTGLRFFAALWVVAVHFGRWLLPTGAAAQVVGSGAVGVDVFFLLSGFILTYTYHTAAGPLRGGAGSFYRARLARIYPVYLLGIALAVIAINPWAPTLGVPDGLALLLTVGLVQSWLYPLQGLYNDPGWSLSAEVFFYALFPWFLPRLARLRTRTWLVLFAALWLGELALQEAGIMAGQGDRLYLLPLTRLPEFLCGVLTGLLWLRWQPHWSERRCTYATLAAIGLAITVLALPRSPGISQALLTGGLVPLWAVLLLLLAQGRGMVARLLGCRPLVTLGEASYSLYILHWPIWCLLAGAMGRPSGALLASPIFFGLYLAVAVCLSVASYRWLETPMRVWIRTWQWPGTAPRPVLAH